MPGGLWQLDCPSCQSRFEVRTGVTDELRHAAQMVCVRCRTLTTVWTEHGQEVPKSPSCVSCGERLTAGDGIVAFAPASAPRLTGPEYVEGPCPVCGASLDAVEIGLWD